MFNLLIAYNSTAWETKEYILPAHFDDSQVPGIPPTTGHIDLRKMTPKKFAGLILEKLGRQPA